MYVGGAGHPKDHPAYLFTPELTHGHPDLSPDHTNLIQEPQGCSSKDALCGFLHPVPWLHSCKDRPGHLNLLLFLLLLTPLLLLHSTQLGDNEEACRTVEEAFLIFAVPGSWFYLMFFCGAIKLTGPFVTMIFKMVTGDMFTFSIVYTICLLGFTQATS